MEKSGRTIPIIILTAFATLESAIAAVKAGAQDFLIKPQHIREILAAIEKALVKSQSAKDNHDLSQMMQETLSILKSQQLNPGETIPVSSPGHGTGKTFIEFIDHRAIISDEENQTKNEIELTSQQASILQYLINAKGKVCSCGQIAQRALNYPNMTETEARILIRPHILRLRKKIEKDVSKPKIIMTVRGLGYRFQA